MEILVKRIESTDWSTKSEIYVDGELVCYGLEDGYRSIKIPKETRVWAGDYEVGLRAEGGMHNRYSQRFDFHEGMLHILDIPYFTYVYFHVGNYIDQTEGCILTCESFGKDSDGNYTAVGSTNAYTKLYNKVVSSAISGSLRVQIIDEER